MIQSTKSIQNKMEVTSRQKSEIYFCKVVSLFRELLEWDLFKSAVITSAAAGYGCKCMGGQTDSEKRTAW